MQKEENGYPKAVWYIFGNELCERFSYHGLKTILVLFFTTIQKYDHDTSTIIFHMFLICSFLSPLFGAIIADSYWGKYKTIFILSIVHAMGNIIVAIASLVTSVSLHFQRSFTIIGLLLTSIGAGGIKPCISAFGGDQFVLPDQEHHLQMFFSMFYFIINLGSLLSSSITPELRKSVQCFGKDSCFPLAFGVPAILMVISMAILVLFFTTIQKYDHDTSTIIFHMFLICSFLSPLFGAIIADSYWGKYKTIFILSIVHAMGNIIVAIASLVTSVSLHFQRSFTIIGLLLTSIGAGGIKPCISAFGGDQFVLPDQEHHLQMFFSMFYFIINLGSLLSSSITPELRKSVQCFGKDSCFPLAFGVPAILMVISMVFFVIGKNLYKNIKPTSSIITTSIGCIFHALKKKITTSPNQGKKKNWLEYADDKYNTRNIFELRSALDVMYLFIPVPMFYALFDQQGSRWILQGTLMNGKIDFLNWSIKPDQMHLINPLFVLIFIPLFNAVVYPILYKIGINTPLKKVTLGGLIAASSFVCAAIVQYTIIGQTFKISSNEGQLRMYNNFDCNVSVSSSLVGNFTIEKLDVVHINYSSLVYNETDVLFIDLHPMCELKMSTLKQHVFIDKGKVSSYFLTSNNDNEIELKYLKELRKLKSGNTNLRILHDNFFSQNIILRNTNNKLSEISFSLSTNPDQNYELPIGTYDIYLDNESVLQNVDFLPVSINDLLFHHNFNQTNAKLITLEKGKYIHILWQIPQTILITIAEVMFVVTLLEFSFTQAPLSMKSFLSAVNLCTTAVGNILIVIISKIGQFENQGHEFLFYAVLMVLDMMIFMLMSTKYKYKCINTQ